MVENAGAELGFRGRVEAIRQRRDAFLFSSPLPALSARVAIYSNIIQARHNVGHKHGSDIEISEIAGAIDAADSILESLDQCFLDDE
jgi:hypothetical protein